MNNAGVTPKALVQKWQFGIEIAGFNSAYFEKATFPEIEFEETTFNPAGSAFPQKVAGRASFKDITLEKGVPQDIDDNALINWIKACMDFKTGTGGFPSEYMKDIDLVQYDRKGNEVKRFRLYGAWVKNAKFGEVEGGSSDNVIETITITYQYFDIV